MKLRPLILVSASVDRSGVEFEDLAASVSNRYTDAVARAGALPVILPIIPDEGLVRHWVNLSDGILLTGGDDLHAGLYRKRIDSNLKKTLSPVSLERDLFEFLLVRESIAARKPLLAICRGHQLVNVALGGTLVVDLPLERPSGIDHNRFDLREKAAHQVEVQPKSRMAKIFKSTTVGVNSTHHQAIDRVAAPFAVTAWSADRIPEALELKEEESGLWPWFLSVQFHPERMPGQAAGCKRLFREFVAAAQTGRARRS